MAYRNKTYICFDGDKDMWAYRIMQAWKQNDNTTFNFYDAHDLCSSRDTSTEETIKSSLRERLNNTKVFLILVGESTKYLYKFVQWEIEQALKMNLPIIVVNINGERSLDETRCPILLKKALAIHVSFNAKIVQFALENWEIWHYKHQKNGKTGPFYYNNDIYKNLGL